VLLATPVTLIAVLRAVAMGWRQEVLADNAREVCELGRELHRRLGTLATHVAGMGRGLERAVDAYNGAVGSLESRVLVTARRFADLGVTTDELAVIEPITKVPRRIDVDEAAG
jgi:DNA recombination protein RmuC